MEIKFNSTACRCLRPILSQVQLREQTQEVRLPDTMPDIGRVLGCWGVSVLRGKEWRSAAVSAAGGVMAWVMYAPEDGSEPRTLEAWLPFQMKWDIPETERDGFLCISPVLKSIDARSTSARKLMVRANVSTWAQAMENGEQAVYEPGDLPEDVQLLKASYPMELPQEFGEKMVSLEEELTLPGNYPPVEKVLRYEVTPVITEQRVMASRLIFRGKAMLHMMYMSGGRICVWDTEVSFSQYADLDRDYGSSAVAVITPVLTNLELESSEGKLMFKCGITAQFVIYDRVMVELTEDAYCPHRGVKLEHRELELPARLDSSSVQLQAAQTLDADAMQVVDVSWLPDHPRENGDGLTLAGTFQILYYDAAGNLQCTPARYEMTHDMKTGSGAVVSGLVRPDGTPQGMVTGQGMEVTAPFRLDTWVSSRNAQPMVAGMEIGEAEMRDPAGPSLILQRYHSGRLWDVAKDCGSTVEAIRAANTLENDPSPGQMLLIPIS